MDIGDPKVTEAFDRASTIPNHRLAVFVPRVEIESTLVGMIFARAIKEVDCRIHRVLLNNGSTIQFFTDDANAMRFRAMIFNAAIFVERPEQEFYRLRLPDLILR